MKSVIDKEHPPPPLLNFNQLLVVLYKVVPENSPTLQSYLSYAKSLDEAAINGYRLLIWDNSPEACEDVVHLFREQLPLLHIQYVHTPENTPLSKIYNQVAAQIAEDSYLTLLDQDTSLPVEYFEELALAQRSLEPLILPKVICQGRLVSPGTRFFAHGRLLESVPAGNVKSRNLLAINSGMSIRGDVFRRIRYDERLNFYGTDTYFMKKYESKYDHAFVLNQPIEHSLAVMTGKGEAWHDAYVTELFRTFGVIYRDSSAEVLFVRLYAFLYFCKTKILKLIK